MIQSSEYGFKKIVDKELTVEHIFKAIPEEILWKHYIGSSFQLNKLLSAPYRPDKNPSFSLKLDHRDRIMFSDFGRNEYGDIFNYLQMIYSESFIDSLRRVNYDFKLGLIAPEYIPVNNRPVTARGLKQLSTFSDHFAKEKSGNTKIGIYRRPYTDDDLQYWMSYGIRKQTLDFYNVYCIGRLLLNGVCMYDYSKIREDHRKGNPCYAYHFPKSNHMKCYFPFNSSSGSSDRRFISNVNNFEDIQGYYQCNVKLRSKKLLILTKSMKDCMCLRELGYEAMAIHGEGHRFNSDFIRHIKKYYPTIISIYDMDETGVKGAKYLWRECGILPYFIPRKYRKGQVKACKDISDVIKQYGLEAAKSFLRTIEEDLLRQQTKQQLLLHVN